MFNGNGKIYGYQITSKVEKITSGEMAITKGVLSSNLYKLEAKDLFGVE